MNHIHTKDSIIGLDDPILVTGATGFIGQRVVENLIHRGFRKVRCFVRPSASSSKSAIFKNNANRPETQMFEGNLLSREDCFAATEGVAAVLHLAAGRGEKSFPDAYMNSVVTTRNLLDACVQHRPLRFVNVSSFSVYTNRHKNPGSLLDETCPIETRPEIRGEAYCFAKTKQDEMVMQYGREQGIPYVIVRPGVVYGAGNLAISGRVGVRTFGPFLHLGGSNQIPLTYVDNCAEAIVLAGIKASVDGEVFNIVDDDLPSSRKFLRLYKKNVKHFPSLYLPKFASYTFCHLWERYVEWSEGQLPLAFNRSRWHSFWKKTKYSNAKLKERLGWAPIITTEDGLQQYFSACRVGALHA